MKTIKDISELSPIAQKACNLFLNHCANKGLKVRITETYRSQKRQNELYAQGRTTPGHVVTWTKKSRHTSRRAWDICQNVKGKEYSDRDFFEACGDVAEELDILWGGNWNTPDMPHFEIGTNWTPPEESEDNEMTTEERIKFNELVNAVSDLRTIVDKLGDRITKLENPMIYNYIDDNMPQWARPTVQKLVDMDILKGDENGLGLNYSQLKLLVILDRSKAFDRG